MFAIVIWDSRSNELKMWRDRPGIKPLYYYFDGRQFAFASELKAIEKLCGTATLEVDGSALECVAHRHGVEHLRLNLVGDLSG
jgi:asparagine synthase (glutamine-hydrolysing)